VNIVQSTQAYVNELIEQNKAVATTSAYSGDLADFTQYLAEHCPDARDLGDLSSQILAAYMTHTRRRARPNTATRKGAALRGFLRHHIERGQLDTALLHDVEWPSPDGKDSAFYPPDAITEACARYHLGTSRRFIMELFRLGIRPGEIQAMRFNAAGDGESLFRSGSLLFVSAERDDLLVLDAIAQEAYVAYAQVRAVPKSASRKDLMFYGMKGGMISRHVVWLIVRNAAGAQTPQLTPQVMRASRIIELLEANQDPHDIKQQLGFADVSSVLTYQSMLRKQRKELQAS